ncbi:MAG TPA: methyltransferase domain-containing protein [Rhizobiaceae bacterium]|nr:methyltransferase domain-containing protein [Rhizobiaceae bacterium]
METVFDTELLLARRIRALRTANDGADFLMRRAAEDLGERLATVNRRFGRAGTLFCVTGSAADVVEQSGKAAEIVRVEADERFLAGTNGMIAVPERVPLPPASIDLAISLLSLQEMNDVPGMLVQICRALKPDGLFLGTLLGTGTLSELRECLLAAESEIYGGVSPRVAPFVDVRDAGGLLQRAGFALPVADSDPVNVRYDSLFDLMRDLRSMGATNVLTARSRQPVSKRFFLRAAEIYAERFSDADGRIRATFDLIWLSGWAPASSQPKPLARGSAKISLASVLSEKDDKSGRSI